MGFERMCKVLQNKDSIYETDLFAPFLELLEKTTGLKYIEHKRLMRVVDKRKGERKKRKY